MYKSILLAAAAAATAFFALPASAPALQRQAPASAFAPKRFSVLVHGSGPDVILIPGLASPRSVWHGSVNAVPGYRYHLVQVAGFAGDPARANASGAVVAPTADEIARYIAARGLRRPAIVGHSMGGTIAMMVAARHPALVGRAMVVDMLPQPAGLLGSSATGMSGLAQSLRSLTATPEGRRLVGSLVEMFGPEEAGRSRSDSDVVARATSELAVTDMGPELARIGVPLTVVYAAPDAGTAGALDDEYRAAYARKPGARLVRIDRSGHMVMADQPARFQAVLNAFLEGR